jgi:hypothetical protein
MTGIIDRFEGVFAVVVTDDNDIINIQRDRIPSEAAEGDYITMDGNIIQIDHEETARRRKSAKKNMDLWED